MLRNLKNKMRNQKGQIGEIVVIVLLIIFAVLGVMLYIKPMFDQQSTYAQRSKDQTKSMLNTMKDYGKMGDTVSGQEIINIWDKYCKSTTEVTITWNNGTGTGTLSSTASDTTGKTYYQTTVSGEANNQVDLMATYRITDLQEYDGGGLKSIEYTKQ